MLANFGIGTPAAVLGIAVLAGGALLLVRAVPEEKFVEYSMREPQDAPIAIAAGTDGSIWFTIDHADAIGRLWNGRIERLPTSSRNIEPLGLAVAADGSAWYTGPRRPRHCAHEQRRRDRSVCARHSDHSPRTAGDRARWRRLVRRPDRLWHDEAEGRSFYPLSDRVREGRTWFFTFIQCFDLPA